MKSAIAVLLALATNAAHCSDMKPADAEPWEGRFSNGTVIITRSVGPRGGDEFVSSACAKQLFAPRMAQNGTLVGAKKQYAIETTPDYSKRIVAGSNRCMPAGTYDRLVSSAANAAGDNVGK